MVLSENPKIELLNTDSEEYIKSVPDKYFDCALIDPPYGIGENGDKARGRFGVAKPKSYVSFAGGDKSAPAKEFLDELIRISKNQIIFGANHFISNMPYDSSCWIVWDKDNGQTDFADVELAWTSFKTAARIFKYKWNGMLQQDMKNKEHRFHPTQKPVALYEWIITKYCKPGQKIIDTHSGSANSGIACYNLGLDYLGIELSEHYYNLSIDSIKKHLSKQTLFGSNELNLF